MTAAADTAELRFVGRIVSPLRVRSEAPKQGDEGAPDATVVVDPEYVEALEGVEPGGEIVLVLWLHEADRSVQRVHPRGDTSREPRGVFATRSPDRPNPIGLHRVTVLEVDGGELHVDGLEAIDGTPVLDIKPVLNADASER